MAVNKGYENLVSEAVLGKCNQFGCRGNHNSAIVQEAQKAGGAEF